MAQACLNDRFKNLWDPDLTHWGSSWDNYLNVWGERHFLWTHLANLLEYGLELRKNQLGSEDNSEGSRHKNTNSFGTPKSNHVYYKIIYLWAFQSIQLFCPLSLISLFGLNSCYLTLKESWLRQPCMFGSCLTTVKR